MSDNNEATAVSKLHKVREEIADFMPVVNVIGWLAFVELLNSIYGTVEECSETRKIVQWLFVAVSGIPINLLYHWQLAEDINAQRTNIEHLQGKYVRNKFWYMAFQFCATWIYLLSVNSQPIACHLDNNVAKSELYVVQITALLLLTAILELINSNCMYTNEAPYQKVPNPNKKDGQPGDNSASNNNGGQQLGGSAP